MVANFAKKPMATQFYPVPQIGEATLYVRVRSRKWNIDIKLSTNIHVDAGKWSQAREKSRLYSMVARMKMVLDNLDRSGEPVTSDKVRKIIDDIYFEKQRQRVEKERLRMLLEDRMTLKRFIRRYLSDIETGHRFSTRNTAFSPGSIKSIRWAMTVFHEFQCHHKREYDFDDIDPEFLSDYRFYLEEVRQFSRNTASKCVKELCTILSAAKYEGLHDNPYYKDERFGISRVEVDSVALSEDEIVRLMTADISGMGPSAQLSRDVFLVGICTAQRISDYGDIKRENLEVKEIDGETVWIVHIKQKKTGTEVAIPCRSELRAILGKYDYNIPHIDPQVLNRNIKEIARRAGIDQLIPVHSIKGGIERVDNVPKYQLISSHTARRTGATLLYIHGVDLVDIMKITGHRSPEMLRKYIKADLYDAVRKLRKNEFFK